MRKLGLLSVGGGILVLTILCSTALSGPLTTMAYNWPSDFRPYGGYIDEILFTSGDATDLLTEINESDARGENAFSDEIAALIRDPNVKVDISPSLWCRSITLNCARFPTNITGYRRAMAFGMDKHLINLKAEGGGGDPLDSYIPPFVTEWEVESQLNMHFYEADFLSGNASLEAAGFIDFDNDGWREYDVNHNGIWDENTDLDDRDCEIEIIASPGWDPAVVTSDITADGLQAMGMRATVIEDEYFWDSLPTGNFHAACLSYGINPIAPLNVLYEVFRSGESWADDILQFSNNSIDEALDVMMNATSKTDAKEASTDVIDLLLSELPEIVCYNVAHVSAYRIDKFEGYTPFRGYGMVHWENPYIGTKVHLKDSLGGPYGGIFRYQSPALKYYDKIIRPMHNYDHHFLQYIYEKLWQIDPVTWEPIPGLAEDWEVEATIANAAIQDGEKYTFYLNEDATWHDGQPVTSEDVKYSLDTAWAVDLGGWSQRTREVEDIYRIDTPDDHTVVIYVNKTGYFEWALVTSHYILPKHIWEPQNLTEWWPLTPTEMTGSGPYKWNSSLWGEYVSLVRHDDWHWNIRDIISSTPTTVSQSTHELSTTSMTSSTAKEDIPGFDVFLMFSGVGTISIYIRRRKKNL
ncbi:MAG: ABC transporter substrate-binding protein [Promethearchaeota archaeon]